MSREPVESGAAPKPIGPYSQAVVAGDFVFLAGQVGLDPATGKLVHGGAAAQAAQAIRNLGAVLDAAGATLDDVVKTTVYLVDLADGPAVNEVYGQAFSAPHPARASVQVAKLPAGARVEIDAIAVRRAG
jgi:2-iminobutanoate/2-iminopropanoate deaminase